MSEKLNRTNPKWEGTKNFKATEVTDTWIPELSSSEDYQVSPDFIRSFRECMVWKLSRVKCMWEILCQSRLSKVLYFRNYQDFQFSWTQKSVAELMGFLWQGMMKQSIWLHITIILTERVHKTGLVRSLCLARGLSSDLQNSCKKLDVMHIWISTELAVGNESMLAQLVIKQGFAFSCLRLPASTISTLSRSAVGFTNAWLWLAH